jgi:pyruvate formate lyase activating enzyme
MKGLIFSVKRYSIHDGPGIRVTFFMKGCPLSCWWCHNPEGISPEQERVIVTKRIGDREFSREEEAGRFYSVSDIIKILDRERIFLERSEGGVTFSGGEPVMQVDFLREALKACKVSGYHTAIDTSGHSTRENINALMQHTDLFLFDLKLIEDADHLKYTGVSNSRIIDNLKFILEKRKDVIIRIPVIPGKNDDLKNLTEIRKLISIVKCENLKRIDLLPFHRIGAAKYRRFNLPYRMNDTQQPSNERMIELKEFFEETGLKVKIGG